MMDELRDLVVDVREQVAYLQELGVESLDVTLADAPIMQFVADQRRPSVAQPTITTAPVVKAPPPKIEIEAPPRKVSAGTRLASLPSLKKRVTASLNSEIQ